MARKKSKFGILPPAPRALDYMQMGIDYANRASPAIIEQARAQGAPLPIRNKEELMPAMKAAIELMEDEYSVAFDYVRHAKSSDFAAGWWSQLVKNGVYRFASMPDDDN